MHPSHLPQQELKLKDKECERLSKVREQLEQELEELTASLFEVPPSSFSHHFLKLSSLPTPESLPQRTSTAVSPPTASSFPLLFFLTGKLRRAASRAPQELVPAPGEGLHAFLSPPHSCMVT